MHQQEKCVVLNNGRKMPIIGLGTWSATQGVVAQTVRDAIDVGYRHVDCAHIYANEHEIGEALTSKINEGVIKREDIFLTSKLWNTFHRPDLVRGALETTLKNLQTSYIDLYLIHWPVAFKEEMSLFFPLQPDEKVLYSSVDFLNTWKEMEKLVDDGLAKSIGISNFNRRQTERLLANCRIRPVTNQLECHPYLTQLKLDKYLQTENILMTAYAPLGSPSRPWAGTDEPVLIEDPKILNIAKKYNKSAAQILIRYQIQRGHIVIPKTATKSRMISNYDVFDFELTDNEVKEINGFDCNGRFFPNTDAVDHPEYPFHDEY